jgi:hypothetical protein
MAQTLVKTARVGTMPIMCCLALSCAGTPAQPTPLPLGQPFELRAGARTTVDDVAVTFLQVNSDSRCPMDALCVWAGEGVLSILVSPASSPSMTATQDIGGLKAGTCVGESNLAQCVLTTTPNASSASHAAYTVRLVQLAPYPRSAVSIRPEDYVATLVVSRH